jgi:Ca2+:H+ antiporter
MRGRPEAIVFSREDRVMGGLLLFVLAALVSPEFGWPPALQFFMSVAAIVPLAAFIGTATEELADRVGGRIGGLLNATFGNAPDILVGVFGVQKGLIALVKATLIGAMISNSALIMGICFIVAGLRYRNPRFDRAEAGHHSVLMMLALAAVLFPSVGAMALCGGERCAVAASSNIVTHVSVAIALVLLLSYVAYVIFGVLGLQAMRSSPQEGEQCHRMVERAALQGKVTWPPWFSFLVLAGATALLVPITDILTSSINPVTGVLGWTQVFVGIVIVANAGNAAEGYAAIRLAWQRGGFRPEAGDSGLDLSLGIASASSIQIAAFVAPIVVLYSLTAHTMNLVFDTVEIAILGLLTLIFAYVCHDGESNWLEGFQLLSLYAMAAIVFYSLPANVFAGG